MNQMRWLLRMSQWARKPPPLWKVLLVFGVVLACLALVGVEKFIGWPDWMTVNGQVKMP